MPCHVIAMPCHAMVRPSRLRRQVSDALEFQLEAARLKHSEHIETQVFCCSAQARSS